MASPLRVPLLADRRKAGKEDWSVAARSLPSISRRCPAIPTKRESKGKALIQQVRALRLSVNRVEQLLEDKVEARLTKLETWAAGHEEQAKERWQRIKDHGGAE